MGAGTHFTGKRVYRDLSLPNDTIVLAMSRKALPTTPFLDNFRVAVVTARKHSVVAARLLSENPAMAYEFRYRANLPLLWEIHSCHQVLEAGVRTQVIETGIDLQ